MSTYHWSLKWGIPLAALYELQEIIGVDDTVDYDLVNVSEADISKIVQLEAAELGHKLMRNNTGVAFRADGAPVRFGLGNEDPELLKVFKMGDYVGWRRVLITQEMVGTHIAQFMMREIKKGNWRFNAGKEHERAQLNAIDYVNSKGGDAAFANRKGTIKP